MSESSRIMCETSMKKAKITTRAQWKMKKMYVYKNNIMEMKREERKKSMQKTSIQILCRRYANTHGLVHFYSLFRSPASLFFFLIHSCTKCPLSWSDRGDGAVLLSRPLSILRFLCNSNGSHFRLCTCVCCICFNVSHLPQNHSCQDHREKDRCWWCCRCLGVTERWTSKVKIYIRLQMKSVKRIFSATFSRSTQLVCSLC